MPYRYSANKINRFLRRRHHPKEVGWVERKAKPIKRPADGGFAGFTIGPAHRVRPEPAIGPAKGRTRWAGPMAGSGRTRWLAILPSRACGEGRVGPATTYQRAELPRSSYSCEAAAALPRRGASPMTFRTRTPPWSATVTTSPHLTSRPGAATRTPLTRTCPTMASDAAALRVRTIRAFHSHRSIRCRSADNDTAPQRRSLAFASSWALRAASLANGEFGSICFSRSRTGA